MFIDTSVEIFNASGFFCADRRTYEQNVKHRIIRVRVIWDKTHFNSMHIIQNYLSIILQKLIEIVIGEFLKFLNHWQDWQSPIMINLLIF